MLLVVWFVSVFSSRSAVALARLACSRQTIFVLLYALRIVRLPGRASNQLLPVLTESLLRQTAVVRITDDALFQPEIIVVACGTVVLWRVDDDAMRCMEHCVVVRRLQMLGCSSRSSSPRPPASLGEPIGPYGWRYIENATRSVEWSCPACSIVLALLTTPSHPV